MNFILSAAIGWLLSRGVASSDLHALKFALTAARRMGCREAVAQAMEAWSRWGWGLKRSVCFGLCFGVGGSEGLAVGEW